jgi:DNA repair protein RecN (Recombination protein N)
MNPEARKIAAPAETALEQAYALAEEARRELDSLLSRLDGDANAVERTEERCSR